MARRVNQATSSISHAAEYNRLLAAADAIARDRLSGGGGKPQPRSRRCHRSRSLPSADHCALGGIVGFNAPLGDPDLGPADLARFVRDATIQSVRPIADEHQVDSVWPSSRSPRTN